MVMTIPLRIYVAFSTLVVWASHLSLFRSPGYSVCCLLTSGEEDPSGRSRGRIVDPITEESLTARWRYLLSEGNIASRVAPTSLRHVALGSGRNSDSFRPLAVKSARPEARRSL